MRIVLEGAHTGDPGDGIIAISPVEMVVRIRSRDWALYDEL